MQTLHNIPVNENLLWDYDFSPEEIKSEAFLRWYLGRVLSHGTAKDLQSIDFKLIKKYLPTLSVPRKVLDFWNWYFSLERQPKPE